MQSDEMQPYGAVLAANVRAARARADLTQETLAERMRVLGCRWHFQTVGAVERGQRPLQAYEVTALAIATGTTPDVLLAPPPEKEVVLFGETAIPSDRITFADGSVSWSGESVIEIGYSPRVRANLQAWIDKHLQGEDTGAADEPARRPGKPRGRKK